VKQPCPAPKVCKKVSGQAQCYLDPSLCAPGSSECASASTRADCDASGKITVSSCPSCANTPLGPTCQVATTTKITGAFNYEARVPNNDLTNWGEKFEAPAQEVLVLSFQKIGDSYQQIDSTISDSNGAYTISVANPPGPEDVILVAAARPTADNTAMKFAVAIPDTQDGQQNDAEFGGDAQSTGIWQWQVQVSDVLSAKDGRLVITEEIGSGVMRVFDYLRYVHGYTESLIGKPGKSLIIWMRHNTSWKCGACMYNTSTGSLAGLGGLNFDTQIFIPATDADTSYWSDPVTAHELGHWVMASYSTPLREGGTHFLTCTTYPGQAWSEGWATGFSSLARASSVYYDKQGGSFFTFDVAPPGSSSSKLWPKPDLNGGLYQLMAENEVASVLWSLASKPEGAGEFLSSSTFLLDALTSPRMTQSVSSRGYKRHSWGAVHENCTRDAVVEHSETAPMIADYLDALTCAGTDPSAILDALQAGQGSGEGYPYDPSSPLCQ
jgi:hypothetical protein